MDDDNMGETCPPHIPVIVRGEWQCWDCGEWL